MTTRYEMCENAAWRLEREAFAQQNKGRKTPLKQFIPCAKALVYTAEMGRGCTRPQSLVTLEASMTWCACHNSLSRDDLIHYELPKKEL